MKWYQVIECDNTVKEPMVCDHDNFEIFGFSAFDFKHGKEITNWNCEIFIQAQQIEDDGEPDDALQSHLMLPIFSKRFISELKYKKIVGIQFLPINVLRSNNELLEGFCIANILNYISAFNYEKSIYNRFADDFPNPNVRGKIAGVRKFVLFKDKLKSMDIIRLKDYKQRFFVSERFKKIFEKNKFTGYSFDEVELT